MRCDPYLGCARHVAVSRHEAIDNLEQQGAQGVSEEAAHPSTRSLHGSPPRAHRSAMARQSRVRGCPRTERGSARQWRPSLELVDHSPEDVGLACFGIEQ